MSDTSRSGARQGRGLDEGQLLAEIDLVTFDCFGTLVDWATALPALGVEATRMPQFLAESVRLQRPAQRGAPFLSYREILARVGAVLRPDLEAARLSSWARGFGELAFFDDAVAGVRLLGGVVDVGVISNCDLVHQLDVERRLGRPWDVCVTADELGAYKPTDRAWDAAIARVLARGYDRDRWLHVSAWDDYDLLPAGARGVRTAYVPRPGASEPAAAAVDLRFSDLRELARTVAAAKHGPVSYDVDVEAKSAEIAARYHAWMLGEHLAAVRACAGVRAAELLRLDDRRFRSSYRFRTRGAYDRYLERDAPHLRARARELFAEDELVFRRSEALVLAST
jgi:FMN phosphatase YigB (HAD superfamily)